MNGTERHIRIINHARKSFSAILAMLQAGILIIAPCIAIAHPAELEEGPGNLSGNYPIYKSLNTLNNFSPHPAVQTGPAAPNESGGLSGTAKSRLFTTALPGDRRADQNSGQAHKPLSRETETNKSYVIPALEIPAFLFLLNMYDRVAYPDEMAS